MHISNWQASAQTDGRIDDVDRVMFLRNYLASALVCGSDGTLIAAACGDGSVCVSQPNGLGVCQLEKPKKAQQ
jgi:hypothetical protein